MAANDGLPVEYIPRQQMGVSLRRVATEESHSTQTTAQRSQQQILQNNARINGDEELPALLIGDPRIGKSVYLRYFIGDGEERGFSGVVKGEFFHPITVEDRSILLKLNVPPDNTPLENFIKKSDAYVVAFSPSIKSSFVNLPKYVKLIRDCAGARSPIVLLSLTSDSNPRMVPVSECSKYALSERLEIVELNPATAPKEKLEEVFKRVFKLKQTIKNTPEVDYMDPDKIPKEETPKSRKFQFLWKSQDDAGVKNRSNSVSDAESQSKSRSKFFTMRFGSKKNKNGDSEESSGNESSSSSNVVKAPSLISFDSILSAPNTPSNQINQIPQYSQAGGMSMEEQKLKQWLDEKSLSNLYAPLHDKLGATSLKSLVYLQEKDLKKLKKYAVKALQLRQLMDEVIVLQRQHMVKQMNGESSPVTPANSPDHQDQSRPVSEIMVNQSRVPSQILNQNALSAAAISPPTSPNNDQTQQQNPMNRLIPPPRIQTEQQTHSNQMQRTIPPPSHSNTTSPNTQQTIPSQLLQQHRRPVSEIIPPLSYNPVPLNVNDSTRNAPRHTQSTSTLLNTTQSSTPTTTTTTTTTPTRAVQPRPPSVHFAKQAQQAQQTTNNNVPYTEIPKNNATITNANLNDVVIPLPPQDSDSIPLPPQRAAPPKPQTQQQQQQQTPTQTPEKDKRLEDLGYGHFISRTDTNNSKTIGVSPQQQQQQPTQQTQTSQQPLTTSIMRSNTVVGLTSNGKALPNTLERSYREIPKISRTVSEPIQQTQAQTLPTQAQIQQSIQNAAQAYTEIPKNYGVNNNNNNNNNNTTSNVNNNVVGNNNSNVNTNNATTTTTTTTTNTNTNTNNANNEQSSSRPSSSIFTESNPFADELNPAPAPAPINQLAPSFSWEIPHEELQIEDLLGNGSYGQVLRGKWRGQTVAIKQVQAENLTPREMQSFESEAKLMLQIRPHPNIITLLGVCRKPVLCIVQEFVARGNLSDLLLSTRSDGQDVSSIVTSKEKILRWAKNIASGMCHLQFERIVHRDLAARNVLITLDWVAKVSDFGYAREARQAINHTKQSVGPIRWMAPESMSLSEYGVKTDVYSYAITLWEIVSRRIPYEEMDYTQVAIKVHQGHRLKIPEDTPQAFSELIQKCWAQNPNDRPDFVWINDYLEKVRF